MNYDIDTIPSTRYNIHSDIKTPYCKIQKDMNN